MTTTTTYTCDKCKQSTDSNEQMWKIQVMSTSMQHAYGFTKSQHPAMEVCRECYITLGFIPKAELADGKPAPKPPTIEDLIVEIVQNHLDDQ